jgi:predicted GIY-YIG superfamily endonuclease
MAFWVYMLQCADDSYYVGHTDDIEKRLNEHKSGELGGYTSTRRPVRVVFTEEFPSREEALATELQIKGWSRAKKQALIRGDWSEVSRLARRRMPFRQA